MTVAAIFAGAALGWIVASIFGAGSKAATAGMLPGTWVIEVDGSGEILHAERRIDAPTDWGEIVRRAHGE